MRKELTRQSVHLVYGIALTMLTAWNVWIGVTISLLFTIGILIYRVREYAIIAWFVHRLEREERIAGFGALTLTIGITSVFLILPEQGVIAGIGVAIIDSIATVAGLFATEKRKHLSSSLIGGFVFFIIATSLFSDVRMFHLAIAALAGAIAELAVPRTMLIDDNIAVPWAIAIVLALL